MKRGNLAIWQPDMQLSNQLATKADSTKYSHIISGGTDCSELESDPQNCITHYIIMNFNLLY